MNTIVQARSEIFTHLTHCPVCASPILSAEKNDVLETVEFVCGSAFYLQSGSIAGVSRICPAPNYVAVKALEATAVRDADRAARAEGPHDYCPSIMHMGDCAICGNRADHPNHEAKAGAA